MRQRDIFWFWLPLFASWLLMTAEGPIITAAINRLPNQVVMLAAQGIVLSLSVTIESPIINLLATSTAQVKDYASYRLVRRFTIHWIIGLTLVTILVAFTPLFDVVVRQWLDVPEPVAVWVQPGMQIMTLWSAAIAWRRFLQGVLIRFNRPRQMAWGTAVRLLASGGTVIGLAVWTDLPGVINGSTALMVGVIAEAIYATIAVQPILRHELRPDQPQKSNLTYSYLFWFHLPLAATSLLVLLAQPLITFSLARLDQPTESLAAWPVLFQIMLMARAAALALPEAVIALSQGPHTFKPIRRFSITLAMGLTILMTIFVFTPLSELYVFVVQEMTPLTGELTLSGLLLFLPFPALATITSWLRGLLINEQATKAVNMGMAINLLVTAVVLGIGLQQRLPGLPTAAVALNLAAFVEIIYLTWRTERALPVGLSLWRDPQPLAGQAAD